MKHGTRKNHHAVALGRLGGLVRSEAKRRANRENGRKGGLVKSRKKEKCRATQCPTSTAEQTPEEGVSRGGCLDSRPFRISRYRPGLWRYPLFRTRTSLSRSFGWPQWRGEGRKSNCP